MLYMSEYAKQNLSKSINPLLMEINNDWNKRFNMNKSVYSTTLNMLNKGDSTNFNFNNGDD